MQDRPTSGSTEAAVGGRDAKLSRRKVLQAGLITGAGLASAALLGCGDDEEDAPSAPPPAATTSGTTAAGFGSKDYKDFVAAQNANQRAEGPTYPYQFEEPDKPPKRGGTLVQAFNIAISGVLDPNRTIGIDANQINGFCSNKLVGMTLGPRLDKYHVRTQPELARSWEISPDGQRYSFKLQPNVKYQNIPPVNGRFMTAQDIALALQRFAKSTTNSNFFELTDTIAAQDNETVVVTMKRPDPDFATHMSLRPLSIYPPEVYDQDIINRTPIGTGPGILDSIDRGQGFKIRSNPDYWRGAPLLDGFELRIMPDPAAQLAAFRAGQTAVVAPQINDRDPLKRSNPEVVITEDPPGDYSQAHYFDVANPKFSDVRVRRALSLAFDRDRAVRILFQGRGFVLPTFPWQTLFDRLPGPSEFGSWWKYDPAQSRQLLSAAGADGLEFSIVPTFGRPGPSVDLYIDMLREVGVTIRYRAVDATAYQTLSYGRDFVTKGGEAMTVVASQYSPLGHFYEQVYSQSIRNQGGIRDPQIDEWATQQRSELNPQRRREIRRRIFDRVLDLVFYVADPKAYESAAYQPWLRWYRFNGPNLGYHNAHDMGRGFEFAWIDK